MTKNPEFDRNLWLAQNPVWLMLTPLLVTGIFLAVVSWKLTTQAPDVAGRPQWEVYAFALFAIITIYAGALRALVSINVEIREHTWDGQRMSAIPPWSMAWGKLFGGTVLIWYGGLVCVALYVATAAWLSNPIGETLKNAVIWILAGVIAQSALFLCSLLGLIRTPTAKRDLGAALTAMMTLFPCLAVVPFWWFALEPSHDIAWFGWSIDGLDFLLVTAAASAAWVLTGLYFAMRREFQYTNSPLAWLAFFAFTIVYAAGLAHGAGDPATVLSVGKWRVDGLLPLYAGLALLYCIALTEPMDWRSVRRLGRHLQNCDWKVLFNLAPRAVYTLALLGLVVFGLIVFGDTTTWPTVAGWPITGEVLIAVLLFAARDVGLILYLSATYPSDKSEIIGICALAILYGVLPFAALQMAEPIVPLLLPVPGDAALAIGAASVQLAVVLVILGRRIRSIHTEVL